MISVEGVLRTRGQNPPTPPKVSIMHSLEKSLYVASSLARCDSFVRWMLRDGEDNVLSGEDVGWILNFFIINPATYERDTGKVSFMLAKIDNNLCGDLVLLSDKIKKNEHLNQVDWDLILCGIELYRRKLINQSYPQQSCGDIW
jgi:hypothetical protein